MSWFRDRAALRQWSPYCSFPLDPARFPEEIGLPRLASRALVDARGTLLGFGQYSAFQECCHLSHLVIAPERRGQGLGRALIQLLAAEGTAALGLDRLSLFVLRDNLAALRLYLRLGFDFAPFHDIVALHEAKMYYLQRDWP